MTTASDAIFRRLLARRPVTRTDLAQTAGISRTYAVQITDRLLQGKVLTEVQALSGEPGRPATLLGWHAEQPAYLVALVGRAEVTLGWFRPGDGYLDATQWAESHRGGATITEALIAAIDHQLAAAAFPLAGIGVAIPGIVDSERGLVVQALHLNLRNVLLRDSLVQRFNVPVVIDRAAHAAAFAESVYRQEKDLFYIDTGQGVGGGAIHDYLPLVGHHHASGEIGHVVVWPEGPVCECGKQGCLEALISLPQLSRRRAVKQSAPGQSLDPDDPWVLAEVVRWLTVALTNVVGLLDPKTIVLGPHFRQVNVHLATAMAEALAETTLPEHRVDVTFSQLAHPACEGIGVALTMTDLTSRVR